MAHAFYEGNSLLKWAELQLRGVLSKDDPRYHDEIIRIGLIFLDCTEMVWYEGHGWCERFASEGVGKSWAWLV
jgi:hypothetical protein